MTHHQIRPNLTDRATPLDQLEPHPHNARQRDARAEAELDASLTEHGQYRAIVARRRPRAKRLQILAGHGTVEAARRLGWTHVAAEVLEDVDDVQAAKIVAVDNRTSDLAFLVGYATDQLGRLLEAMQGDYAGSGYQPSEADDILAELARQAEGPPQLTDPDQVPAVRPDPISRLGDVWLLGEHRLVCGDGTRGDVVAQATDGQLADAYVTDPPYGVDYVGKTADALTIENDQRDDSALEELLLGLFAAALQHTREGGPAWIFHPATADVVFRRAYEETGWSYRQTLVWVKDRFVLGRQDHHWQHEPILYGWRPGAAHAWYGGRTLTTLLDDETQLEDLTKAQLLQIVADLRDQESTVVREPRPAASRLHPTMKPTHLLQRILERSTRPGDLVLDTCAGSGSLAITCHAIHRRAALVELDPRYRRAALVELDPRYVDVIARRWQEHTGITPTRPDGTPVDFTREP